MAGPRDLRAFIDTLEAEGELVRVRAEVDPVLEMTEVYDRVVKRGGPALLFERPKGSGIPVLLNALGTDRRMALALGRAPEEIGVEAASLLKPRPPRSLGEAWRFAMKYKGLLRVPPKRVRRAACQEVVLTGDAVDLARLPIQQCWPEDAGRFVTLPLVFTRDPETGERNIGMYRMQVFDRNTTGMHWQTHKHGRMHLDKARAMGLDRLPVSVALGGDPALIYAATAPLPPGIDELLLAGFIRKRRTEIVKCVTNDLEVPASAEIVLEGHVDVNEPFRREGPFGDHTGFYSLADDFPAFHVTAITMRKDAIYPSTVVGVPPHEDAAIGRATERMFLHLLRFQIPELVDMRMPVAGGFHNLMLVSVKKAYPGHARKAMMSLWGAGMIALEKVLVVYDGDEDISDARAALLRAVARLDPARDLLVLDQMPTDTLDHASPFPDLGSHLGLDATRPVGAEAPRAPQSAGEPASGARVRATLPGAVAVHRPGPGLLLVAVRKEKAGAARAALDRLWDAGVATDDLVVVLDADVPVENEYLALFHALANLDPARDLVLRRDGAGARGDRPRVGLDATRKRPEEGGRDPWPGLVVMDDATKAKVTARWSAYGLPERFRDPV
ncbi:MAG TPA: menaquinone biosynthesis decarboxylase [Candidatus Thermoplasmatota archaeon]|nr:menaquinone biosynthesis decarboxylase [Candidatus Thermoplasmatota archaeon]